MHIEIMDMYDNGDRIFILPLNMNGLFCIDKNNGKVSSICSFDKTTYATRELQRCIFCIDSVLYMTPYKGNGIYTYNLVTGEKKYFKIHNDNQCIYVNAIIYENRIILIPFDLSESVLIFNVVTGEFYSDDFMQHNEMEDGVINCCASARGGCLGDDNKIYVSVKDTYFIIKYDVCEKTKEYISLPGKYKVKNIDYAKGKIWCTCADKSIVLEYDTQSGKCVEYVHNQYDYTYSQVICIGEDVYVTGAYDNDLFWIDSENGVIKDICCKELKQEKKKNSACVVVGEEIWYNESEQKRIVRVNKNSKKYLYYDCEFIKDIYYETNKKDIEEAINNKKCMDEGVIFGLEQIIEVLDIEKESVFLGSDTIGDDIWKEVNR